MLCLKTQFHLTLNSTSTSLDGDENDSYLFISFGIYFSETKVNGRKTNKYVSKYLHLMMEVPPPIEETNFFCIIYTFSFLTKKNKGTNAKGTLFLILVEDTKLTNTNF